MSLTRHFGPDVVVVVLASNMLWHFDMLKHIIPESTKLFYPDEAPYYGLDASAAKKKYICAKKAVLYGASVYAFPDWMTAHAFRAKVYKSEGLEVPALPPLTVTILDRKSFKPRHMFNQGEVGHEYFKLQSDQRGVAIQVDALALAERLGSLIILV